MYSKKADATAGILQRNKSNDTENKRFTQIFCLKRQISSASSLKGENPIYQCICSTHIYIWHIPHPTLKAQHSQEGRNSVPITKNCQLLWETRRKLTLSESSSWSPWYEKQSSSPASMSRRANTVSSGLSMLDSLM